MSHRRGWLQDYRPGMIRADEKRRYEEDNLERSQRLQRAGSSDAGGGGMNEDGSFSSGMGSLVASCGCALTTPCRVACFSLLPLAHYLAQCQHGSQNDCQFIALESLET